MKKNMNLMLTASCNDADKFKEFAYDRIKQEFSDWCNNSKSIFAKIDQNTVLELFFDVNPSKLKEWLSKKSTKDIFETHNFIPTRYKFDKLEF